MATLNELVGKVIASGGRIYLVGGSVRDAQMGRMPQDRDYCVTGFSVETFQQTFPEAFLEGKDFPVFRMSVDGEMTEISLARKDKKLAPGHQGFVVTSTVDVTIEEDLFRRDVTVNAMALELPSQTLIDPYGGTVDIEKRTIRAVSAAFAEDPLRVYRAARFCASLDFTLDQDTLRMMQGQREELLTLSHERVFEELKKALATTHPSIFFRILQKVGVLDVHFAELVALMGVEQPVKWHPEGDAFEHTMQVVDAAAALTAREEVRFAALVHDVGKGCTPRTKWPSHPGHEAAGVPLVKALCQRLKLPRHWTQAALFATEHHMKVHILDKMKPVKVVDLLTSAHRNPLGVEGLSWIGLADIRGRNDANATDANAESLPKLWSLLQTVNGKTVLKGARSRDVSGAQFGEELRRLRAQRLERWRQGK